MLGVITCEIVTVPDIDMPSGHQFIIVTQRPGAPVVFCRPSSVAQILARIAYFEWSQTWHQDAMTGEIHRAP